MARSVNSREIQPILNAARLWIDRCLIDDGSVFSTNAILWTPTNLEEVRRAFVEHPDAGEGNFITKLRGQLQGASGAAQQLTAEMLWALLLFPSKVSWETKRRHVLEIWGLSGEELNLSSELLSEQVLSGVGSGGPGFNTHRWRELAYLITTVQLLKTRAAGERQRLFTDYDAFLDWISTAPQDGNRQYRHMLRYFAFPNIVERISSTSDRQKILAGFGVQPLSVTAKWTDGELDRALLDLRRRLQEEHPNTILDFYNPPLVSRWRAAAEESGVDEIAADGTVPVLDSPSQRTGPRNLILFGPPGTGKTHALQRMFANYTDAPDAVDRETWLHELLGRYGWRSVVAASLASFARPVRVPELQVHQWVRSKAAQRGRTGSLQAQIWGLLQTHTSERVETVRVSMRRPPGIFSKRETGEWELVHDWMELDEESSELLRLLEAGPAASREPIRRYQTVTFHPSYSYEDFVRGIRPVVVAEDGTTQFRVVDGIFKQICEEARANPGKRYALFIDEINRANIAKVFGELITLIEIDKRAAYSGDGALVRGMAVRLPGSEGEVAEPPFGVPDNLDLYGTMNTADRSIALLDIALRRRFEFREMEPDYSFLKEDLSGINLREMLRRINDRLEYLLDRDHRIGHAYLMQAQSLDDLRRVFSVQIIPLLQEYFFDDLSRVSMVLATSAEQAFVRRDRTSYRALFPGEPHEGVRPERSRYLVEAASGWTAATFKGIYGSVAADEELEMRI